jgi:putative ABC transport system permease protein
MKILILHVTLSVLLGQLSFATESAEKILKSSDLRRGGLRSMGLSWSIKIESKEGEDKNEREFFVRTLDLDSYVTAEQPARTKGEIYLFNSRNIWFYKPSLKKPISLSARQRLSGQAANGDIASTNYANDYTPTLEKSETLDGEKVFVLLLKAKQDDLTYDKIRYYVSEVGYYARKAEFLTLEGEPFKIARMQYKNKIMINGKPIDFISQLLIQDAKFEKNQSHIYYRNPKIEKHKTSLFNVNNLSR